MALTTVNSDGVKDDSIKNIDVKSDAAIAGSKIDPTFTTEASITQAITTQGNLLTLIPTSFGDEEKAFIAYKRGSVELGKIGVEADNSGQAGHLVFETAASGTSSEKVRITHDGRLLLGTTTAGAAQLDTLTINTNGHTGMTIRSASTSNGHIGFANGTSGNANYRGFIKYEHDGDKMTFATADSAAIIIDDDQNVGIGTDSPASILHLAAGGGSTRLELQRNGVNTTGNVGVINFTASDGHSVANIGAYGDGDNEGAYISFRTTSAATTNSPFDETGTPERLRITSDGKYYFTGTGGGSGSRGLEIDTEAVGAADEGVILNARASGTTGRIKFQTNSATAMTILGNGGNVGIGTDNPGELLTVSGGMVELRHSTIHIDLMETDSNGSNHQIRHAYGNIYVRKIDNDKANPADRLILDGGTGNLTISDGDLVLANTHGINFSASEGGSGTSGEASLLADYETGTWTPNTDSNNWTATSAIYVKVGSLVTLFFDLTNSTGAGRTSIENLPFTPNSSHSAWHIGYYAVGGNTTGVSADRHGGYVSTSGALIATVGGGTTNPTIAVNDRLIGHATYYTNS